MIVQEFIDEVSRRLRDVNKKQWDDGFLTSATNAALGALTTVMPQAFAVNRDVTLVEGTEQSIPDDVHKLVSVLHNVSSADGSAKRAVTKTDMSVLDASYPQWRQDDPRLYIRHWMTDEFDEKKFYVWPPAIAPIDEISHILRMTFTKTPTVVYTEDGTSPDPELVTRNSELPVKTAYLPALQEFAMYYAYSVDDDMTPNSGRAQRHWLAFFQMLNKREDANLMVGSAQELSE